MAKSSPTSIALLISLNLTFISIISFATATTYYQSLPPSLLGFQEEKFTHLHFYFHDIVAGPNKSIIHVAEPNGKAVDSLPFGTIVATDDPLTAGPERDSKLIGKAQGIYASISQQELGVLMAMTMAFTDGEFNGSTISVLGRNMIMSEPVREIAIVGGTGAFRFGRGYAKAKFVSIDYTTGDAIEEFDIFMFHY